MHSHEEHSHTHSHSHEHTSSEEQIALLDYMISHNRHHEEELHDLAHGMDPAASELIHRALHLFEEGNDLLSEALSLLQK